MKVLPLILSTSLVLGAATVHGQPAAAAAAKEPTQPTHASPMKTGVKRHANLIEIKAGQLEACKKLFAAVPAEVAAQYKAAHLRNLTCYLKEIEGRPYLFTYFEYDGNDWARDTARFDGNAAIEAWQKSIRELQAASEPAQASCEVEEVFFTEGAAEVVPSPGQYARIGMITGLKPEKEAEYRTLHATTWPGVLQGIKDTHNRNFTIRLAELHGRLYLIGYLEYVGKDAAADGAAGKALPVNKRWWKFTDACQQPLPAAAAKGEIWDGMTEIYHLD